MRGENLLKRTKMDYCVIQTTTDDKNVALTISKILLQNNLAACIQSYEIESSYRWQGKIENSKEILLNIKTKMSLYKEIEKVIKENHNYEVPEIIVLPISDGFRGYFDWIDKEVK